MKELSAPLAALINELGAVENASMARYTSFRTGGNARLVVEPNSVESASELIRMLEEEAIEHIVIGNGTNLLVSDKGLDMVVVRIAERMSGIEIKGSTMRALAGASYAAAAKKSVQQGLLGLEWAAGIPGTVGGAVVMNAGAYGGDTASRLKTVTYLENGKTIKEIVNKPQFSYRSSPYSAKGRTVLEAEFELEADDGTAHAKMLDYNARRREKQPLAYPSAGSTFKRPQGHFAGALIEQAGLKGKRIGGAEVSTLHAGFIINAGGATSEDVYALIKLVQEEVLKQNGVKLELEVRVLGEF